MIVTRKIKFRNLILIAISIVSILNAIPYFYKYHTYSGGIGRKYDDALSQRAFMENLRYYDISYKIDDDGYIWYTRNNEEKVKRFNKIINYKSVNDYDLKYETNKLKNAGYDVLEFQYPDIDHTIVMWHKRK